MVGGQHDQIVVPPDAIVEKVEELSQGAIQSQVVILHFLTQRAVQMPDEIGGRTSDEEDIRVPIGAEILCDHELPRKHEHMLVGERCAREGVSEVPLGRRGLGVGDQVWERRLLPVVLTREGVLTGGAVGVRVEQLIPCGTEERLRRVRNVELGDPGRILLAIVGGRDDAAVAPVVPVRSIRAEPTHEDRRPILERHGKHLALPRLRLEPIADCCAQELSR